MQKLFSTQMLWLGARLAGAAAGLFFQVCLARVLTPAELGLFFSASSLAAIAGIVATQGYPNIASRFVSRYSERAQAPWLAQFYGWVRREILLGSLGLGALLIAAAVFWPDLGADSRRSFAYAGLCIPAMAALTVLAAVGIARRQMVNALVPDLLVRPVLLAAFAGSALLLGFKLSASEAMLAFVAIAFAVALVQLQLIKPTIASASISPRLARHWRRDAWMVLPVMIFTAFFGDLAIVCATPFLAAADLAAFGVTVKIAMIVGFGVQIAHQILMPDLADAYAKRRPQDAAHVLMRGALFPIAFTASALLMLALFGKLVLRIYGVHFEYALGPLLVLVSGQLVRALGGPAQSLLTLEGRRTENLALCGAACCVLLLGNVVLTAAFGLWGAAIAASAAYGFWIVGGCIMLGLKGGIRTDLVSVLTTAAQLRPLTRSSKAT